jgi:hypothetical protein
MDKKNKMIGIRLSQKEKELMRRKAFENYQTVTDYIKSKTIYNNER